MSGRTITIILVTAMLFGGSVFAASAFTSAEVTRSASIDVVADNNGIITLSPGSTSAVYLDGNGAMTIDAAQSAQGLNVEGSFTYGDTADPANSKAFSMTNSDSQTRTFTVAANNFANTQSSPSAVQYKIYDSTGTQIGVVDQNTDQTFDVASGETVNVVLETDTTGLDSNADLSHDLVITA